ncbi:MULTISPECIES: hypothetical protein [Methylotenera]|uniref:hypothetical protein n=1 Tax=Methylotenera TaxID=359407 RepID=UPI00035E2C56|nr:MULTISPECIES: hypothetical protein [Methylotenera]
MKPVRRKIRRHFGLTAKQVAVRSKRPWYFQTLLAILFVTLGFGSAYWIFQGGENQSIRQKSEQIALENRVLQTKLVGAQRELQIELATNNNLAKELASVQDESIKIKEDLFFYKNMLKGKSSK